MFDKKIKKSFSVEEKIEPICLIPLGHTADDYKESPMHNKRKKLSELVIYL